MPKRPSFEMLQLVAAAEAAAAVVAVVEVARHYLPRHAGPRPGWLQSRFA